jgi:hypothetical protein
MRSRRLLALAASIAVVCPLAAASAPASARTVDETCLGRGPVSVQALPALDAAGCALVGRTVTDGRVAVVVPPAGMSVSGDGVSRDGEVHGLTVNNTGHAVRVVQPLTAGSGAGAGARRASDPPACRDRRFHLEGHHWTSPLRYHVNLHGLPRQMRPATVISQVEAANANMRTGRNTCGKPALRTPRSRYLGRTHVKPAIAVNKVNMVVCADSSTTNIVGFLDLPDGLLGWTCYWYYDQDGRMAAADIAMDNGKYLVTKLPRSCHLRWDFEGAITHEWGHAYGMAHTGSGHDNLTMQHELKPCSTYDRTLGLGDWLGMNHMYGHVH